MSDIKFAIDEENRASFDVGEFVEHMPEEVKKRLAIVLACDTPVMLHVAELLADGITYDDLDRYYYPPEDDMQEARLYLLKNFEEVQKRTAERAMSDRDKAVVEAHEWESTARYLAGGVGWRGNTSENRYYDLLHDAKEKSAEWEAEHGRRIR